MNINGAWNDVDVATLKLKWADGWSASKIGDLIGRSRNSVISKVHSQKLPQPEGKKLQPLGNQRRSKRNPFAGPRDVPEQLATPYLAPPPVPRLRNGHEPSQRRNPSHNIVAAIAIAGSEPGLPERLKGERPDGTGVKFLDLERGQCKWPRGNPVEPDFEFCGGPAVDGLPYCRSHRALAYVPTQSRNRAALRMGV